MVKTKLITVLMLAGLLTVLGSCKGNATSGGSGTSGCGESNNEENENIEVFKAGDIALEKIKIGDTEYDYTAEVYVTGTDGATIVGKTNTNNLPGVFIEGRTVTLSPFIMSKYEVTQELYRAVMTDQKVFLNGYYKTLSPAPFYCRSDDNTYKVLLEDEEQKYRAAEGMTWFDAVYFCNVLSEKTGLEKAYSITVISVYNEGSISEATVELVAGANGYRLPTEAEWEFAARGGDPTKPAWDYTFSGAPIANGSSWDSNYNEGLDAVGWYKFNTTNGITGISEPTKGSAGYGTHQVGEKNPNALGIFDMSGNVEEWCFDWYDIISIESVTNPFGVSSSSSSRVSRHGSWLDFASSCSVFWRGGRLPQNRTDYLGFRVVRNAQ